VAACVDCFGEPHVDQFGSDLGLGVGDFELQDDILRFDVSVRNVTVVELVQRVGDVQQGLQHLGGGRVSSFCGSGRPECWKDRRLRTTRLQSSSTWNSCR